MKLIPKWLRRPVESVTDRLAPGLFVALRRAERRYLALRGQGLASYFQSCGEGTRLPGDLTVTDPPSVAIGNGVTVGEGGCWNTAGGLTVGDRTRIGRSVIIETVGRASGLSHEARPSAVAIGPDVWVGDGAVIRPGARIGRGAVVEAGAVVFGDVPAAVGEPQARDACAPVPGLVHGDDPAAQLFFVVSTGRSGSLTMARVLSQHPRIRCVHEPRPQLIRLSTELAHRQRPEAEIERELSDIFLAGSVFPSDRLHGESDQKYWNLIPMLARLLPASRFIWLIRDGREVVASTLGRSWFPTDEAPGCPEARDRSDRWRFYRLDGAACGAMDPATWADLPLFEKHCWHWACINAGIEERLAARAADSWRLVRLEELDRALDGLFRFLGVEPALAPVERSNEASYRVARWGGWGAPERAAFEKWCGPGMDRWYPGWRDASGAWQPWTPR